jgi:ribose transport system substrate-binding protein
MKKRILAISMTAVLAFSVFAGCGGGNESSSTSDQSSSTSADESSSSSGDAASSESYTIGFANSSLDNPWRVGIQNAIESAVAEYDNVEFLTNQADEDAVTLVSNVEDLISSGCDLIMVCTVDGDTFQPAVDACNEAGIPLMLVDRGITTSEDYLCYVQQSNVQIGADSADWLAEQLTEKYGEPKGTVVELQGVAGNLPAEERHQGFTERIEEKYPDIEIIYSQNTDYSRANSLQVMENIIQGADEFDAVFTHEDEIAIGAIQALEEANRLEGVLTIGDGGSRDAMEYIKEGKLTMTISYSPVDFGNKAVDLAMKYLNGEEIDHNVQITGQIIDSSNVDEMLEKMDSAGVDFAYFID